MADEPEVLVSVKMPKWLVDRIDGREIGPVTKPWSRSMKIKFACRVQLAFERDEMAFKEVEAEGRSPAGD